MKMFDLADTVSGLLSKNGMLSNSANPPNEFKTLRAVFLQHAFTDREIRLLLPTVQAIDQFTIRAGIDDKTAPEFFRAIADYIETYDKVVQEQLEELKDKAMISAISGSKKLPQS